jgi:hypothetical protein
VCYRTCADSKAHWVFSPMIEERVMKLKIFLIGFVWLLAAGFACSQVKMPPETRNAALRYWQAFSEIKDPPADKAMQEEMEKVLTGQAPWNEAKLGGIVAANEIATGIMQRATKLPDCDWGVEYSRGPEASIAFVPRAHVLGRLNTLRGIREMAQGHPQAAVGTWVAGIRFVQDLMKGGSLIFALTAKGVLMREMQTLTAEAIQGHLNSSQKKQLYAAVSALPEDGFDWALAWEMDEGSADVYMAELLRSKDPTGLFETMMGRSAPKECMPPSQHQIDLYHKYMADVVAALRLPPALAKPRLAQLDPKEYGICEAILVSIPSAQRVNDERMEVMAARQTLLQELQAK